ncbi:MAG: DHH family phosphoesterase [bacterium]|nr:DHH family phosphoesterase [bacterium]
MLTDEQQIFDQIAKADNILITFKKDQDGDAVSAALSLMIFLKKLDKKVTVISDSFPKTKNFSFLPQVDAIENELQTNKQFIISLNTSKVSAQDISYQVQENTLEFVITPEGGQFDASDISSQTIGASYDLIITLATPDLEALGEVYHKNTEFFYNTPIINIDHHPRNEEYGQVNHIKITALATTEVLFDILHTYSAEMIDDDIATCLLTGIIAESKSFKIGSLTPNTLTIASRLINLGARREEIIHHLYQSRDLNTLKLWGRLLAKLQQDLDGRLIWSSLNKVDFSKTESAPEDLSQIIEELIVNIPEAEVIVLFTEEENTNTVKVFAFKNIDAREVIKEYSTNGSKAKIEFSAAENLAELEKKVIGHIKNRLAKLPL